MRGRLSSHESHTIYCLFRDKYIILHIAGSGSVCLSLGTAAGAYAIPDYALSISDSGEPADSAPASGSFITME